MVIFGYIALSMAMAIILLLGYRHGLSRLHSNRTVLNRKFAFAVGGLALWFIYVFLISWSGILKDFGLPPRFPILLILPAFVFIGITMVRNKESKIFDVVPTSWTIYYQSFRIVIESLFVATVAQGILHPEVTFQGYNYDIVFAGSALLVGWLAYGINRIPERVVLYWNYLGLAVIAVIIFLFTTTIYVPQFWGKEEVWANPAFGTFPYTLVPAFLMPSAVMVHIFSIIGLKRKLGKS